MGDLLKARLLLERGANVNARGRCGKPVLFYAIEGHQPLMLRWLLDIGQDVEQADDFGRTPLMQAVEYDDLECLEVLLTEAPDPDREWSGTTALGWVRSRNIAKRLLDAGADPSYLSYEGRRALLGFPPDPDENLVDASRTDFLRARTRRFGGANPERIHEPFWESMIRAGVAGCVADRLFDTPPACDGAPVWCAQRFGQSITFLPDGRIVQIGGEHEDSYDKDFCIYNDVFVQEPGGAMTIFGYPESVFPPTDFHTATLIGGYIYVIGSLGYPGTRRYGETPVHRLDTGTFRMERLRTSGDAPGWIYRHRAALTAPHEIRVSRGKVVRFAGNKEAHAQNDDGFVLDVKRLVWRREPSH
jgi:hypothetical protein